MKLGSQLLLLHVQIDALLVAFSCGKSVHPALILNLWRVDCQVRMGEGRKPLTTIAKQEVMES